VTRPCPPLAAGRRRLSVPAAAAVVGFVVAVVGSVVLVPAGSAAATSYRFWTYWTKDPAWTFASVGAARVPADGTVEGWRFSVSAAASSSKPPRSSASFSQICAGTPAVSGSKRVALVLDYGTAADAPPGDAPPAAVVTHCSVVATGATGYDVLADATTLRVEQGLVCGIGGYPARGCGDPVVDPAPSSPSPTQRPSSEPTPGSTGAAGAGSTSASSGNATGGNATAHPRSTGAGADRSGGRTHPRTGTPTVDASTTPAAAVAVLPPPAGGGPGPVGAVVGVGVVATLAAAAWFVARRRRGDPL
jgi:hypothetical protein